MSRSELLEMLIAQVEENESLRSRLKEVEAELQSRHIKLEKAGTIAEASLLLNGVLEAAEQAAAQYLENIENLSGRQEEVCKQMEAEAQQKANAIIAEAEEYSRKLRTKTNKYCKKLIDRAQTICEEQAGANVSEESAERNGTT